MNPTITIGNHQEAVRQGCRDAIGTFLIGEALEAGASVVGNDGEAVTIAWPNGRTMAVDVATGRVSYGTR